MLAISATCANAYDFEANGMYFNIASLTDLTAELTCSDTYTDEYGETIPTKPYSGDFVVPQTVEYLGRTFNVIGIDKDAFINCTLQSLTIPENVTFAYIFVTDENYIKELIIEDSEKPIYLGVKGNVESAYVGRNLSNVEGGFKESSIHEVEFGDKVTHITLGCFDRCHYLNSVGISNSIDTIYNDAFAYCTRLTEIAGKNVLYISGDAFSHCISLTSFNFPNLKVLCGFYDCRSLTNVNLPKGLVTLGAGAFSECSSLESATIPASVISIEGKMFAGCTALKTITACGATPVAISESTFDTQHYLNATLVVPAGAKEKYMNAENWKNFLNIVEDASIVDNVRSVSISSSENYGNIVAGGKTFGNGGYLSATVGESLTIEFVPKSEEYKVSSVMVDGREMVSAIEDNKLTLTISDNTSIVVGWSHNYVEPEPVYLSIKQAEGGCMKMEVDGWSTYEFVVEPSEGWKLHSVTLNGADITSTVGAAGELRISDITENSELAITFESTSSAISAAAASNARVYATGGNIVVTDAESGEPVSIYDEGGRLVSTATATGATMSIPVAAGHVYIVKLNGKTVKLAI